MADKIQKWYGSYHNDINVYWHNKSLRIVTTLLETKYSAYC